MQQKISPGILVIVYKGIGDVLLTTPLLRALKKNIPDSRLYFLTRRPSRKILESNPRLSGVFYREERPLRAIRAAGIDISFDFMHSSSSGLFALFSGASKRVAFAGNAARLYHNITPRIKPEAMYTALTRLQLLEPLGIAHDGPELELYPGPANEAKAAAFLKENGIGASAPLITMDVTSPRAHRRWPAEHFAGVADRLFSKFGARVVFLWGPGEMDYVRSVMALAKEPHLLCPDLDLLDLGALLKRAALHIGTSSAPMHLAVSQATPTFIIYSPHDAPGSWSPPGPRHAWAQGELLELPLETVWDRLSSHMLSLKEPAR
ncbi:MAG: heptosyltransferase III [Elusimicrobia bacterium]|nr:MAG: heptosyltransferase III [Elusimicrobiota bacterium]KAF0156598.1 MAG: heptosyltransferase III [Elusimicrobiota bacterium]